MKTVNPSYVAKGSVVVEPVTLDDLKAQVRITHDDEDEILSLYLIAAREALESATQRSFVQREFVASFDCDGDSYLLPYAPFFSSDDVSLISRRDYGSIFKTTTKAPFEITYVAGECTPLARIAILLWAAHLYESRQPVNSPLAEVPLSLSRFIELLRVINH